jgi:hypothetical protein
MSAAGRSRPASGPRSASGPSHIADAQCINGRFDSRAVGRSGDVFGSGRPGGDIRLNAAYQPLAAGAWASVDEGPEGHLDRYSSNTDGSNGKAPLTSRLQEMVVGAAARSHKQTRIPSLVWRAHRPNVAARHCCEPSCTSSASPEVPRRARVRAGCCSSRRRASKAAPARRA